MLLWNKGLSSHGSESILSCRSPMTISHNQGSRVRPETDMALEGEGGEEKDEQKEQVRVSNKTIPSSDKNICL